MYSIVYGIVLSTLYAQVYGQLDVNGANPPNRTNRIEDVYLRFYNGSSVDYFVEFPLSQAISLITNIVGFNLSSPTVFYAHGYTNTAQSDSVLAVASAYLEAQPGTNIILIDWSNMAQGDYVTNAAPNTKVVGVTLAGQINILINNGVNLNNIHLVGHSLGAQVIGYASRTLQSTYQKTLKRLTGLDPANPGFYPVGVVLQHISASDAEFVDIIHSDAGGYGAPISTGTADFWPNGGISYQPGCPIAVPLTMASSCSHGRSWAYYAESVRNSTGFPAGSFASYAAFLIGPVPTNIAYMGYACSPSANGSYFLSTNTQSPYARGKDGLTSVNVVTTLKL